MTGARSPELVKRYKEDAKMMNLINTMTPDRLAFWAESMANAVYNTGMAPAPVQEGKYRVYRLPFPSPRPKST